MCLDIKDLPFMDRNSILFGKYNDDHSICTMRQVNYIFSIQWVKDYGKHSKMLTLLSCLPKRLRLTVQTSKKQSDQGLSCLLF